MHSTERLFTLVAALQHKWGRSALVKGTAALPWRPTAVRTGFDALDRALQGGIPRAAVTEIAGRPTSGATSLALHIVAQAQSSGTVAYIDMNRTFDPIRAEVCRVNLPDLLLLRPRSIQEGFSVIEDTLHADSCELIVVSNLAALRSRRPGTPPLDHALRRYHQPLSRSRTALVMLNPTTAPHEFISTWAAVRLVMKGQRWMQDSYDQLTGFESQVEVVRTQRANPPVAVTFSL